MTIERDYLYASEIRYIGEMICNIDNADFITKDYLKYLTVADFCTDFKLERGVNENGEESISWKEENYDKLWEENGIEILNNSIRNIDLIDKFVEDRQSIYNMIKDITAQLGESVKNFNLDETKDILSKFEGIIDKKEK